MKTAFNGGGGGGAFNGGGSIRRQRRWTTNKRARRRWRLTPAGWWVVTEGVSVMAMAAMDEGGRWCLTVAMDGSCGSGGQ
jgi:hypothetical protein